MPDHRDSPISFFDAADIAAQWHSVMTWSDPGVAMYSITSTGKIHSEEHRAQVLAYIEGCIPQAHKLDASDNPDDKPNLECEAESNTEALYLLAEWARMYILDAPGG